MGSRQIVLVYTAGFSVLNTGIFWREAKTKRLFSQCTHNRSYCKKYEYFNRKRLGLIKNTKTTPNTYLGQDPSTHVNHSSIHLVIQSL